MKPDCQTRTPSPSSPASHELRGAERFALLLRRAKLVGESAEYPCIIRDVSATGVRLRLFHALPADRDFMLELSNGDIYGVEPVRESQGHEIGFRFTRPIDVASFLREASPFPKREIRLRLGLPALIVESGHAGHAVIRDLSQNGARIETGHFLRVGQQVRLRAKGLPELAACVRWRLDTSYGLVFKQYLSFDELARLLVDLHAPAGTDAGTRPPGGRVSRR